MSKLRTQYKKSSKRKRIVLSIIIGLVLIIAITVAAFLLRRRNNSQVPVQTKPSHTRVPIQTKPSHTQVGSPTKNNTPGYEEKHTNTTYSFELMHDLKQHILLFIEGNSMTCHFKHEEFNNINPITIIEGTNTDLFNDYNDFYNSYYEISVEMAERGESTPQNETNFLLDIRRFLLQQEIFNKCIESTDEQLTTFKDDINNTKNAQLIMANFLFGYIVEHLLSFLNQWDEKLVSLTETLEENTRWVNLSNNYFEEMETLSKEAYEETKQTKTINTKDYKIHFVKDYGKFKSLSNNVMGLIYMNIFKIDDDLNVNGLIEPLSSFLEAHAGYKEEDFNENCKGVLLEMEKRYENENVGDEKQDINQDCYKELFKLD